MALEIASGTVRPGKTFAHQFANNIAAYVVGIRSFNLSYGTSSDHWIRTASISLSPSASGQQLSVNVDATLVDSSGNSMDVDDSYIELVALAWTGAADSQLLFTNVDGVSNGSSSQSYPIPGTTTLIDTAALAGFDLSYGNSNHQILHIAARAGVSTSSNGVAVTSAASMYDGHGNNVSTATVDGGLIVNCDSSLNIQAVTLPNLQNDSSDTRISFNNNYNSFLLLLTGFQVQFNGSTDHNVRSFGAGLILGNSGQGYAEVNGSAWMQDNSGNHQSDGNSYASGIIIGYTSTIS
ncbi:MULTISPECIES: hypothetical protein [Lysobacter]|uniref:hypothetical protein n=1 Tax=Lysobacter TaxID=68 RepID=UPI000A7C8DA7|nr:MULTISPECIES: hypothetical protein [Lysobacter]